MDTPERNAADSPTSFDNKQAAPQQWEDVLLLVSEFHKVAHLPFSQQVTGAALRRLLEDPNLGFVLLAKNSSSLVGYILIGFGYSLEFGGRDAFVDELYVRPDHQRKGIGTALLRDAERFAVKRGISALHLESDFENPGATSLYECKGYAKHPRFLMTKWLDPSNPLRAI